MNKNSGGMKKMKTRMGFVSNSSTASFICLTNLKPVKVKQLLQELLDFYNKWLEMNYKFEQLFKDPYMGTSLDVKYFNEFFGEECKTESYYDYSKADGNVIIMGAEDNSIPDSLIELIQARFEAIYIHLG